MTGLSYSHHRSGDLGALEPADLMGGFFEAWPNPPTPETHLALLRGSSHVVLARAGQQGGDEVIGFVTAISDGVLSAYIPLLEVLPAHRGRGIGRELVRRLLDELAVYMVDVSCDDDVVAFYERFGFSRSNAMVLRDYDRQSGAAP